MMISVKKDAHPRRLLRDAQTNRYYKGGGQWTEEPEQAQEFEDLDYLRALVRYCRLQSAEIVEQSGNGVPDVHTPVEDSPAPGSWPSQEDGHDVVRGPTTGELLDELKHERDAAQFELLQARRKIADLCRRLKLNSLESHEL